MAQRWLLNLRMAVLLMILLVVGYAWSVWSLKRQEHFDERAAQQRHDHRLAMRELFRTGHLGRAAR